MDAKNESLDELKNSIARARLLSIQEVVTKFDVHSIQLRSSIISAQAVIAAFEEFAKTISVECIKIQKLIDANGIDQESAKAKMSSFHIVLQHIANVIKAKRADKMTIEGKIQGLESAADISQKHFDDLAQKYERYQRMAQQEEAAKQSQANKKVRKKKTK